MMSCFPSAEDRAPLGERSLVIEASLTRGFFRQNHEKLVEPPEEVRTEPDQGTSGTTSGGPQEQRSGWDRTIVASGFPELWAPDPRRTSDERKERAETAAEDSDVVSSGDGRMSAPIDPGELNENRKNTAKIACVPVSNFLTFPHVNRTFNWSLVNPSHFVDCVPPALA